jgi:hypothetical protein
LFNRIIIDPALSMKRLKKRLEPKRQAELQPLRRRILQEKNLQPKCRGGKMGKSLWTRKCQNPPEKIGRGEGRWKGGGPEDPMTSGKTREKCIV